MREGWKVVKLSDICLKITDGSHNPPRGTYSSKYMMLSSKNIFDDYITLERPRYLSEEHFKNEDKRTTIGVGDVLLTIVGTVGRSAVVPLKFPQITVQRSVAVLKPNTSILKPRFLMYSMHRIAKSLLDSSRGVAQKGFYLNSLRELSISLPPLPEQKRIVAILDKAFAGIDKTIANTEKNLANARELFESYSNEVFEKKGEGWVENKLENIAYLAGRIGWKGLTAKEYTKEGPLFLSVYSLNYGDYVDFRDAFHITQQRYDESPEIMLQPNDILICKDGAGIGKLGIVKELPSQATINSSLLLIRTLNGIQPKYLYYALNSNIFQKLVKERIDGATTPHLYQREIKQFSVPVPQVIEQNAIIKRLNAIRSEISYLEMKYRRKIDSLTELKQSLLQKAFVGELTDKPEPVIKEEAFA